MAKSLTKIPYANSRAFEASIANLTRRCIEQWADYEKGVTENDIYAKTVCESVPEVKTFLERIDIIYGRNNCDDQGSANFLASRRVWNENNVVRGRNFRGGNSPLTSGKKDVRVSSFETNLEILREKLCMVPKRLNQGLQSEFTGSLQDELYKLIDTFEYVEETIKLRKRKSESEESEEEGEDAEVEYFEKKINVDVLVRKVANARMAAREAHMLAKEAASKTRAAEMVNKSAKEKSEGWTRVPGKQQKKPYGKK
jgi:hypothetical protein